MSDIRGSTSDGKQRNVLVDKIGRLITRAILHGLNQFGNTVPIRTSTDGTLLIGDELWVQMDSQQVTVSSTALTMVGNTLYTDPATPEMELFKFQLEAGGPIRVTSSRPVTAGGTEGSKKLWVGDTWTVSGKTDIANHQAIRATGGADATVNIWPFKRVTA